MLTVEGTEVALIRISNSEVCVCVCAALCWDLSEADMTGLFTALFSRSEPLFPGL